MFQALTFLATMAEVSNNIEVEMPDRERSCGQVDELGCIQPRGEVDKCCGASLV